jgi:4-hydroxybenzoate polyprenyltransferase
LSSAERLFIRVTSNPEFSRWRAFLILARASNLPTVWSNCLAAWLLGDGEIAEWPRLSLLCLGATLLYTGGMFLNDAFDAQFDAQHRRERPVPSGAVPLRTVWRGGFALLAAGLVCLIPLGLLPVLAGVLLCCCIVIYDAVHKMIKLSPVLMALCRFLLYLVAASAARGALTGRAVWSALALAAYVAGLSYLARRESTGVRVQLWPLVLLAGPLVLAGLVNDGHYLQPAMAVGAMLVLWSARSLRTLLGPEKNVARSVSGLLAGIVLVDLLAVADVLRDQGAVFIALFLLALLFQRFIPAT